MTIPLSSYLSARDRIEGALRYLESVGLEVKPLWLQHADLIASADTEAMSEDDKRYTLPVDRPTIPEHFTNGRLPQFLTPGHAWVGYSYQLTPGQRSWLRDNYGLTPTQTVTLVELTRWPSTQHPRMLHIRSDLHVDPRHRRHMLIDAVIRQPGKFFKESAQRDAELEAEKQKADAEKEAKTGKVKVSTRKVPVDVEDYLSDLEKQLNNL